MLNNKKGMSVDIVILVILTLAIVLATLYTFVTSAAETKGVYYNTPVFKLYQQETDGEFYLIEAGSDVLEETFDEFVSNPRDNVNFYMGTTVENPAGSGDFEFSGLNPKLNENFKKEFLTKFKQKFLLYGFDETSSLKNLKDCIASEEKLEGVNFNEGKISLTVTCWNLNNSYNTLTIKYNPVMIINLDFRKIGLNSFDEIYTAKQNCKISSEVCYEELLKNFEATISVKPKTDGSEYSIVTLTSKKLFLINGNLKKIEFSFIPA
jgi:hypothetical protein